MSAHHHHANMAPRGALLAAGGMVVASLLLVISVRVGLLQPTQPAAAIRSEAGVALVAQRDLQFIDQPDGTIRIQDAADRALIDTLTTGEDGFIRGVMRSMARERRMHGGGADAPVRLSLWQDGGLTLLDPVTGRTVELNGFGPTNRAAFARLLEPRPAA